MMPNQRQLLNLWNAFHEILKTVDIDEYTTRSEIIENDWGNYDDMCDDSYHQGYVGAIRDIYNAWKERETEK